MVALAGDMVSKYYRKGYDLLLNPLDARSLHWDLWKHGSSLSHYGALAASISMQSWKISWHHKNHLNYNTEVDQGDVAHSVLHAHSLSCLLSLMLLGVIYVLGTFSGLCFFYDLLVLSAGIAPVYSY